MNVILCGLMLSLPTMIGDSRQESHSARAGGESAARNPYLVWSEALLQALRESDITAYNRLVDADAILDRAFQGVDCSPTFASGYRAGVLPELSGDRGTYGKLKLCQAGGGRFDFLRVRGEPLTPSALFRCVRADDRVDYLEFPLERRAGGNVRAVDVYQVSTGEYVSATLRRQMLPLAVEADKGILERLFGREQAVVRDWKAMQRVMAAAAAHDRETLAKQVQALPPELRYEKTVILTRVFEFWGEDARYVEAIEDLREHFPADPCTQVHSVSYFWLKGEHALAYEALENLRAWVGGDPYLHVLRAQFEVKVENYDSARASALKAIDEEPDWIKAYWVILTADVHEKRFERALATLRVVDQLFEVEWGKLADDPVYSEFMKSPQHPEWLEYLKASRK